MKDTAAPPAALAASQPRGQGSGLDLGLFLVMSLIWGTTWVVAKVGITAMPPIFFAALRYALVAALFLTVTPGVLGLLRGPLGGRVLLTGLLVNTGTYALILWGMQHIASGIAGLVNLTMIAVGLYALALLRGRRGPPGAMPWPCCWGWPGSGRCSSTGWA